jgi:hypothetical protein
VSPGNRVAESLSYLGLGGRGVGWVGDGIYIVIR